MMVTLCLIFQHQAKGVDQMMEVDNGRDDMSIDGQSLGNGVPGGFNASYLKLYYGKSFFLLSREE